MPSIVVNGDVSSGLHTPVTATGVAKINGKQIAVHGDRYGQGSTAIGSLDITLNGKKIIIHGDSLTDGDHATASGTVSVS